MIYLKAPYCQWPTRKSGRCSRLATAKANDQWVCTQHWKLAQNPNNPASGCGEGAAPTTNHINERRHMTAEHYFVRMVRAKSYKAPISCICACGWRTPFLPTLTAGLGLLEQHRLKMNPPPPPRPGWKVLTAADFNSEIKDTQLTKEN